MAELTGRQSGTVTIASGETSDTASVTTYTEANTILLYTYRGGFNRPAQGSIRGRKTNPTTLTFVRDTGTEGSCVIEWELLEFNTDVEVQDFTMAAPDGTSSTQAITEVTLSQSFIIPGGTENGGSTHSLDDYTLWKFNSNIQIEQQTQNSWSSPGNKDVQVVDFTGASVQEKSHVEVDFESTATTDAITSVSTTATWLIGTYKGGTNSAAFDDGLFRLDLQSATQARFLRAATTSLTYTFNYWVVEFTDGTTIQTGLHTLADTDPTDDISISSVTMAEAASCLGSGNQWQNHGSNDNTDDDTRDGFVTAEITSQTVLRVTRETTSGACNLAYFVMEWNVPAVAQILPRFDYQPYLAQ